MLFFPSFLCLWRLSLPSSLRDSSRLGLGGLRPSPSSYPYSSPKWFPLTENSVSFSHLVSCRPHPPGPPAAGIARLHLRGVACVPSRVGLPPFSNMHRFSVLADMVREVLEFSPVCCQSSSVSQSYRSHGSDSLSGGLSWGVSASDQRLPVCSCLRSGLCVPGGRQQGRGIMS